MIIGAAFLACCPTLAKQQSVLVDEMKPDFSISALITRILASDHGKPFPLL